MFYFYRFKFETNMKKILLILFLFISLISANAQQNNVQQLIHEGVELHDQGEYRKAIEKYNQALRLDSKAIQATYELALSYLALKDYNNASRLSTQVINSNNKQLLAGAYAVKSEALSGLNRLDDAIALLKEGIEKNGDTYPLHFNLALNYFNKRDLDNTLIHVKKAIDIDKTNSGAFLLNAYALTDKGLWVQSLLSFQMFLLLEPDSRRSKNAFDEMIQTMRIKSFTETPVERSFIQQQLFRNQAALPIHPSDIPPLTTEEGLNRNFVYHAITTALDSLKKENPTPDIYNTFKVVNKEIIEVLERENNSSKEGVFWTFYVPFFTHLVKSKYYDTYARYISVSYIPESYTWWQENPKEGENFVIWFEKGDH